MSRVLFANSYFLVHDPKEYRNLNLYAPLGTLYAASYIRESGYEVKLFDTMLASSEKQLGNILNDFNPDFFVIYDDVFNYLTKMCLNRMRRAAFEMIHMAKACNCNVIVSGSDATDNAGIYLSEGADFVIRGEGEITLLELLNYMNGKGNRKLNEIDGITYIDNGTSVNTSPRKVLKDPDFLPMPAWDLIDMDTYRKLWKKHHGYFSMNLVTTRGCPFHCNWCAKPIYGQVYNSHSPEYVVKMMKHLIENYSPDHIWFCDDIFGLKPGWVRNFSELLNQNQIRIPFKCLSRADLLLKEDTIKHLAEAGCESLWMGAESGSQKILDAMEKGTTVDEIYRATQLLRDSGIKVCFFLQFGYTGETMNEIKQTIRMIHELMPDDIGISVSYPLPGTRFYDRVVSQMKSRHNWEISDDFAMLFDGEYSTGFYRTLHKKVHKGYRLRQILKDPAGRISDLWKLPVYFLGWIYNSMKLYFIASAGSRGQKIIPQQI
jgi:radical SAM superfamily enzyme YgiQ (UPF0313 family)